MESYNEALRNVIEDCIGWDSESSAIQEAFDRGIEFNKLKQKVN